MTHSTLTMASPYTPAAARVVRPGLRRALDMVSEDAVATPQTEHTVPTERAVPYTPNVLTLGAHSSTRSGSTDAATTGGSTDTSYSNLAPKQWTHEMLCSFLESQHVPEQTLELVQTLNSDGADFYEVCTDVDAQGMLENDYGIQTKPLRVQLIGRFKRMQENSNSSAVAPAGHTIRTSSVIGEKQLHIPSLPRSAPGQTLCTAVDWKNFTIGLRGWAELGSEDYSTLIHEIHQNPDRNMTAVCNALHLHLFPILSLALSHSHVMPGSLVMSIHILLSLLLLLL